MPSKALIKAARVAHEAVTAERWGTSRTAVHPLCGHQAAHAVRGLPWVRFTDPEIAHVGLTEEEARKAGQSCSVVRFPYTHNEPAVTGQEPVGLMKFHRRPSAPRRVPQPPDRGIRY